jgi:hypothetical protein
MPVESIPDTSLRQEALEQVQLRPLKEREHRLGM